MLLAALSRRDFAWTSSASSGFTRSLAEVESEVQQKIWPAMRASLFVWPLATGVNLVLVPLPYRVLFVNVVGMGYGMLMSWMANDARVHVERAAGRTAARLRPTESGVIAS